MAADRQLARCFRRLLLHRCSHTTDPLRPCRCSVDQHSPPDPGQAGGDPRCLLRWATGAGLGGGWLLEEAAALGHPTDHRSARLREAIDILRLAWSRDTFSYSGRHWVIPDVGLHPHPAQGERIPLWIGGHGQHALEIAADAGCGVFLWGGYPPDKVADYVVRVRTINPEVPVATLVYLTDDEDRWSKIVLGMEEAGANLLVISGRFETDEEYLDAVRRFGEHLIAPPA